MSGASFSKNRMAFVDSSVDIFGVAITCGCFVTGTHLLKPEWPLWILSVCTVAVFALFVAVLPGRRKPRVKKA